MQGLLGIYYGHCSSSEVVVVVVVVLLILRGFAADSVAFSPFPRPPMPPSQISVRPQRMRRRWTSCYNPRWCNSPAVVRSGSILLLLLLRLWVVGRRTLVAGFLIVSLRPATIPLRCWCCVCCGWVECCTDKSDTLSRTSCVGIRRRSRR